MPNCESSGCVQGTWRESLYCNACFRSKWGPDQLHTIALPPCLFGIVFDYWDLSVFDFTNADLLRLVIQFVHPEAAAQVLRLALQSYGANYDIPMALIADFCGFSSIMWTCLCDSIQGSIYGLICAKSFEVTRAFFVAHPYITFDKSLFDDIQRASTDDACWWLLSRRPAFVNYFYEQVNANYRALSFSTLLVRWRSRRILQQMIDMGCAENKDRALEMLVAMINCGASLCFFEMIWNIHFQKDWLPQEHNHLFYRALAHVRESVLDFCATRNHFQIESDDIVLVIDLANSRPEVVTWVARHKLITREWLSPRLHDTTIVKFAICEAFVFLPQDEFTTLMLDRKVLIQLLQTSTKENFYKIFNNMAHMGTDEQFQAMSKALCMNCSLFDIMQLAEHALIKPRFTFAMLRGIKPDFFSLMCSQRHSMLDLQLFENWHDVDGHTLSVTDVVTAGCAFAHLAKTTHNSHLSTWIAQFMDAHSQHLLKKRKRKSHSKHH